MRYLYMDESGDAGLPEEHSSHTRHMVYAGVILTPEQCYEVQEGVQEILDDHFTERGIEPPEELHYNDVVRERGSYGELTGMQRKALCDSVFELMERVEPVLIATVIDKKKHEERYVDPVSPKSYSFRSNVERFHFFLDDQDEYGSVIIDESENFVDNRLRRLVYQATDEGIKLAGTGTKIPRIMDSAMTTPSEMSPGVQLADFVAYVTWCHYERDQSDRYQQINQLWRDPSGDQFTEPSLLPAWS